MMFIRRLLAVVAILLIGSPVLADDPPDRLEKKPRPAAPDPAKPPAKPADKADDDKKKSEEPTDDAAKLREKIAADMQSAEKKLKDQDPGRDTQELQDRVLRNIDKLLDLARNAPPPPQHPPQPMDGSPPPMGGDGQPMGSQQPKSGMQPQSGGQQQPRDGQSRREKREQRRKQMEEPASDNRSKAQAPGQAQPGSGRTGGEQTTQNSMQPGMGGQKGTKAEKLADMTKDIWGHLPETLRQEMDHYYRDRFMPRYRDLLQEYYGRLAERERTRKEDK